jgi:hypothetical protein
MPSGEDVVLPFAKRLTALLDNRVDETAHSGVTDGCYFVHFVWWLVVSLLPLGFLVVVGSLSYPGFLDSFGSLRRVGLLVEGGTLMAIGFLNLFGSLMFVGCLAFVGSLGIVGFISAHSSLVVPVLIFCLGSLWRCGFLAQGSSLTNLGMLVSFGSLDGLGFLRCYGPIMTRVCVRDIVPDTAGALPDLQSSAMPRKDPSRTF